MLLLKDINQRMAELTQSSLKLATTLYYHEFKRPLVSKMLHGRVVKVYICKHCGADLVLDVPSHTECEGTALSKVCKRGKP